MNCRTLHVYSKGKLLLMNYYKGELVRLKENFICFLSLISAFAVAGIRI